MDIVESGLTFATERSAWRSERIEQRSRGAALDRPPRPPPADRADISERGRRASAGKAAEGIDALRADPQLGALVRMIEAFTGRAVRVFDAAELQSTTDPAAASPERTAPTANAVSASRTLIEYESTEVSIAGRVRTADGLEIEFELSLSMQRYYRESVTLDLRSEARRKDPLVINFEGTAAQLRDTRFQFDLDADGSADSLPTLGRGSGFLVFDRNANGRIDDGRELFGALSGDGFADLRQLDGDRNGWIDAGDAAYAKLQVWDGGSRLRTLQEAGVAALSTTSVSSPFALRGAGNSDLGQIRSTGVYLGAQSVGTLQQVDLTV